MEILEAHDFPFVDVALRAASILQTSRFCCILFMSSKSQNACIWLDFCIRSMLERLALKNDGECTDQCLKRTSGARVMILCCRSIRLLALTL